MKKVSLCLFITSILMAICVSSFVLVSCSKPRVDEPVSKKQLTTYYFMIEEVDIDGSTMYSPIMTIRK